MINPLNRDGVRSPSEPTSIESAPLVEALHRHRRGYEIEDATLVEMAALLDELKRKYRSEIDRRIEDRRLLKSSIQVAELNHAYLRQEADVIGKHIGNLYRLHQQASGELRQCRRWIKKLYPGWSRIFDEAKRRAVGGEKIQK